MNPRSFLDLFMEGLVPESAIDNFLIEWSVLAKEKMHDYEYLGFTEAEWGEYLGKKNLQMLVLRRKHKKCELTSASILTGCYIKFGIQYGETSTPHIEYGWISNVTTSEMVDVQCDDGYEGARGILVDLRDVFEILPLKERPILYYKQMLCHNCFGCNPYTSCFVQSCKFVNFFKQIELNRKNYTTHNSEYLENSK